MVTEPLNAAGLPETSYTLQVYLEDCTGCGLCVEACPVKPIDQPSRRAINLTPKLDREADREAIGFFESIPVNDRSRVDFGTIRGTQFLEPLFEFSGACTGCGETPYLKLLSQLFGDRATIANATGCSSIYGGNLPTTPYTTDADGRYQINALPFGAYDVDVSAGDYNAGTCNLRVQVSPGTTLRMSGSCQARIFEGKYTLNSSTQGSSTAALTTVPTNAAP